MIFHLLALHAPQKTPRKAQPRYSPPPTSPTIHQLDPFPRSRIAWLKIGDPFFEGTLSLIMAQPVAKLLIGFFIVAALLVVAGVVFTSVAQW
jgi:hypothetical protein